MDKEGFGSVDVAVTYICIATQYHYSGCNSCANYDFVILLGCCIYVRASNLGHFATWFLGTSDANLESKLPTNSAAV